MPDIEIPRVNIGPISLEVADDAITEDNYRTVGQRLFNAFTTVGFCYMENHGISKDELDSVLNQVRNFYSKPVDIKRQVLRQKGVNDYVGWLPPPNTPGLESMAESFDKDRPPDLKETYNLQLGMADSKYPKEEDVPGFRATSVHYMESCNKILRRLLVALGYALGLDNPRLLLNYVEGLGTLENTTVLRYAHYPKISPQDILEKQLRCAEHTDFGLITFLFQNEVPGLQVFTRDGKYINAPPIPGAILLNVCDILERMTGGILISAKHRVVVDEMLAISPRLSVINFTTIDNKKLIEPLCGDRERYQEKLTCVEFLKKRAADIFIHGQGVRKQTSD